MHDRGVVATEPGLSFGLPFLFALTSSLVGGVGGDAEYIAELILTALPTCKGCRPKTVRAGPGRRGFLELCS